MSTSTALVPANVLGELKLQLDPRADERWMQLTRGSLSDPATGRTLHQVYSRLAHTCAVRANRAAHRRGWGPSAAAARIEAFFGMGMEREEKLEALRVAACPGLEGKCSRLLRYALPRETAKTQVQAFKNILTIVTRYPGTQALFLKSKHLGHGRNTEAAVSALWTRADDTHTRDWDFYCGLAAVCLSDTDISSILGNLPPRFLGCTSAESGALGVLERLLIVAECSESAASTALAQRYLTGILEMPTFWRESGLIHSMVFTKILARLSCVLNDLGLDSAGDEDNQAVPIDNMFDTEGIDAMTSAILTGVLGWPTATDPKSQYWYRGLAEVVQLLRRQEAESLLPRSWELADGPGLRTIISDPDAGETMTVLMMPDDDDGGAHQERSSGDNSSLNTIGSLEALSDPSELHSGFSGLPTFRGMSLGGRRFWAARRSSWGLKKPRGLPQGNESAPVMEAPKSPGLFRRLFLRGTYPSVEKSTPAFSSPDQSLTSGSRIGTPIQEALPSDQESSADNDRSSPIRFQPSIPDRDSPPDNSNVRPTQIEDPPKPESADSLDKPSGVGLGERDKPVVDDLDPNQTIVNFDPEVRKEDVDAPEREERLGSTQQQDASLSVQTYVSTLDVLSEPGALYTPHRKSVPRVPPSKLAERDKGSADNLTPNPTIPISSREVPEGVNGPQQTRMAAGSNGGHESLKRANKIDSPHPSPQQLEHDLSYGRSGQSQFPSTSASASTPPEKTRVTQPSDSPNLSNTPVPPKTARTNRSETLKSFKVSLEDPTWKVLPAALKKYRINDDNWQNYAMFICYGSTGNRIERCLSYDEKPLFVFQKLKDSKKNPVFMLKHIKDIRSPIAVAQQKHAARKASSIRPLSRPPWLEVDLSASAGGPAPGIATAMSPAHGWPELGMMFSSAERGPSGDGSLGSSAHHLSSSTTMTGSTLVAGSNGGHERLQRANGDPSEVTPNSSRKMPPLSSSGVSYAVAIYPYMAEQEDEFDVVVGDIFIILSRARGWWVVQRDPTGSGVVGTDIIKQGWVPAGCLLETNVPVASAIAEATAAKGSSSGSSNSDSPPETPVSKTPILPLSIISTSFSGIVIMDYKKKGDEELDLVKDDALRVFKRYNHWSYAVKEEGGDRGWVPSWFIGKVVTGPATPSTSVPPPLTSSIVDDTSQAQVSPMPCAFPAAQSSRSVAVN